MIELEPFRPPTSVSAGTGPALIVVTASAGGFEPMLALLAALPPELDATVVVVLHRAPQAPYMLDRVIQRRTLWPVSWASEGEPLLRGVIYVAPHDRHLSVSASKRFELTDGERIQHVHSSANPLLESASLVFGPHLVAVVLSGAGSDATDGVRHAHEAGGMVIVQDPSSAEFDDMPRAAIGTGAVDEILPAEEIATAICTLVARR